MKILLVEDDKILAELIVNKLTQQKQYLVDWVAHGTEGLEWAKTYEYDLILLDLSLPELDGITICQQLRNTGNRTPILLLTASDRITEKVTGLDAGADDYLVKPFDYRELLARIRALSRRNNDVLQSVLQWENLILDPNNCQVEYQQQVLKLTAKEYSLLELFLRHPQRIFDRDSLIEQVWSWADSPSDNAVRTQIKSLRHKLKDAGLKSEVIETIYGLGYRLKEAPKPTKSSQKDELDAIWNKYQIQYRDRILVLQQATQAIKQQRLDRQLQQQAISISHTLIGSLGSFGFKTSSQICRQIEALLKAENPNPLETAQQLEKLLQQLLGQLKISPDEPITEELGHFTDSLTDKNNCQTSLQPLRDLCYRARTQKQFWCLAIITMNDLQTQQYLHDPEKYQQTSDQQQLGEHYIARLKQFLNQKFRQEDTIIPWESTRILIGLYSADKQVAIARLNTCLNLFLQQELTKTDFAQIKNQLSPIPFSIVVAQYPQDGDTLSKLYQHADNSPNRVLTAEKII